jgi:hypothetical protein
MSGFRAAGAGVLVLAACARAPGPSTAEAYARALEADRLDQAYRLTTPPFQAQVGELEFRARFSDPAARAARAAAVRAGMTDLVRAAPELFGPAAADRPAEAVVRFAAAVRAGRFDQAWELLSLPLRARYTPELLSRDFRAEPTATARLERALVAVEGVPVGEGATVRYPLGGGGAVVLLHEPGGWRLEALE